MLSDSQRQRMMRQQLQRETYLRRRSVGLEPETEGFEVTRSGRLALHPVLAIFPAAAFLLAVALDVAYLVAGSGGWAAWSSGLLFVGLIGSLPAATIGAVDWLRIPAQTRAKALARWHGVTNLSAVALFAGGWVARLDAQSAPGFGSVLLVWSGAAVLILGGVLGGELATRLDVQVSQEAPEAVEIAVADVAIIAAVDAVSDDRKVAQA